MASGAFTAARRVEPCRNERVFLLRINLRCQDANSQLMVGRARRDRARTADVLDCTCASTGREGPGTTEQRRNALTYIVRASSHRTRSFRQSLLNYQCTLMVISIYCNHSLMTLGMMLRFSYYLNYRF